LTDAVPARTLHLQILSRESDLIRTRTAGQVARMIPARLCCCSDAVAPREGAEGSVRT
jgi:hypothetical protein